MTRPLNSAQIQNKPSLSGLSCTKTFSTLPHPVKWPKKDTGQAMKTICLENWSRNTELKIGRKLALTSRTGQMYNVSTGGRRYSTLSWSRECGLARKMTNSRSWWPWKVLKTGQKLLNISRVESASSVEKDGIIILTHTSERTNGPKKKISHSFMLRDSTETDGLWSVNYCQEEQTIISKITGILPSRGSWGIINTRTWVLQTIRRTRNQLKMNYLARGPKASVLIPKRMKLDRWHFYRFLTRVQSRIPTITLT